MLTGSNFKIRELEALVERIVYVSQVINPNVWQPFSFDLYLKKMNYDVKDRMNQYDKLMFDALVKGGSPFFWTNLKIEPGYLLQNENGEYVVTEKFIEAIEIAKKIKNVK